MNIDIRLMTNQDWPFIRLIYLEGIATGNSTFEKEVTNEWQSWSQQHLPIGRYVAEMKQKILGWAMLSPISNRCVHQGVAEVSIYVAEEGRGKKIGSALLAKTVQEAEKNGLWTLQSQIFPENTASIVLHQKFGFREVGYREKIGRLNGKWRNVVLMERRSPNIY